MTDKQVLRARLRAVRDGFVAEPHPTLLPPGVFLDRIADGPTVAGYVPIGSETDPSPLVHLAEAAGCTIALPYVVDRATPIRFLAAQAPLVAGPFGLRQPPADAAELSPEIILTPLLGFDRTGNRLGQGAGHYDRAFAAFPDAWRIGVAWSVQEVAALPADPWDMPLHAILTEREWIPLS